VNELQQLLLNHWAEILPFLLVLARTSALVVGAPFWGGNSSPKLVRVVITVSLSAAIYPFAVGQVGRVDGTPPALTTILMALGQEVLVGLAIGWTAQMLFAGMRFAGQLIEVKMGIGLTQLIDPHDGGQTSLLPVFLDLLASLAFFAMDGHHLLIRALVSSYQAFPLASEITGVSTHTTPHALAEVIQFLLMSAGEIFSIALRVSAPILMGLLLADVVLGVMSRAVPQLNIFSVVLPVQFAFGLLLLFLALPFLVWFCVDALSTMDAPLTTLFSHS
jgi:flagellar biosynthetic protein FliR